MEVFLILVIACRGQRLKSLPSHRYVIEMPDELSLNASVSIAQNTRLNSAGAKTHPCFTPFVTWKSSELLPSLSTLATMPSEKRLIIYTNFSGQPNFAKIFHNPFLLTESNALVRSTKVIKRSCCCSIHFS